MMYVYYQTEYRRGKDETKSKINRFPEGVFKVASLFINNNSRYDNQYLYGEFRCWSYYVYLCRAIPNFGISNLF